MEGFILSPVLSLERCRMAMDITAEMGIPQVATFDAETDSVRASEYLEALCEMAAERDLKICIEFHSRSKLRSIAAAAKLASEGRYRGLKILIDALHLARGGETPADVAQVPPALIDCVQFCDGPLLSPGGKAYGYEAMFERQVPGAGELPLVALLKSIPQEAFIYLEVPQRAAREQGLSAIERAQRAMDGMRSVIAAAG
jgi:sugar phosphate isomerase/epimerase